MNNYQCEGYGLLALNSMLERRGYSNKERALFFSEFSGEIQFLFDTISPEEAEDRALALSDLNLKGGELNG